MNKLRPLVIVSIRRPVLTAESRAERVAGKSSFRGTLFGGGEQEKGTSQ